MNDLDELDPKVCAEGRRDHIRILRAAGWPIRAIAELYLLSQERIRELLNYEAHKAKSREYARRRAAGYRAHCEAIAAANPA